MIYIQIRLGYFSPWKLAEEYDSWIEIRPKSLMAHNKPKIKGWRLRHKGIMYKAAYEHEILSPMVGGKKNPRFS